MITKISIIVSQFFAPILIFFAGVGYGRISARAETVDEWILILFYVVGFGLLLFVGAKAAEKK